MKARIKIYEAADVQTQWNTVWTQDNIRRNMAKLNYPEQLAIFEKYIKKSDRILEAGCGLGKWMNYFHSRGYDITGLDYSRVAVDALKNYDVSFKVDFGDITSMPYEDNSFDIYYSNGVLEHLEDDAVLVKAISEAHRVLKKAAGGGLAIISIPYLNFANFLFAMRNHRRFLDKHKEFFEYNYTIDKFLQYFDFSKEWTLERIVPENIPLILKRRKKYVLRNQIHQYDLNLNSLGLARWERLLKLPDSSFIRKQNSHLIFYILRAK